MKVVLLLAAMFLSGCRKELSCEKCFTPSAAKTAKIYYSGPLETDGCDWMVYVDSQYYHPRVLANEFKENLLTVNITFTVSADVFICGFAATQMKVIDITSISR